MTGYEHGGPNHVSRRRNRTREKEKELTEYSQVTAKLFDARVFQEMTLTNLTKAPVGDPSLLSYDRILINELCIKLLYWKRTSITSIEAYEKIKEKAEKLIGLIKKEYHLSERTPLEK